MMAGRKYPKVFEGEWIAPRKTAFRIGCCDCGLVHRLNFKVFSTKTKKIIPGKILLQAFVDSRATAGKRQINRRKRPSDRYPQR